MTLNLNTREKFLALWNALSAQIENDEEARSLDPSSVNAAEHKAAIEMRDELASALAAA